MLRPRHVSGLAGPQDVLSDLVADAESAGQAGRKVLVARVAARGALLRAAQCPHGAPELSNPGLRSRSATLPQRE